MLTLIAQQLDFYNAAAGQLPGVATNVGTTADRGFGALLGNLLSGVMTVAALLLLVYLIWGAIDWVTSGGETGKIQKARDKMTQAVIGIIVLASSLAIFFLVQDFIGLDFFNLGGTTTTQSGVRVPATGANTQMPAPNPNIVNPNPNNNPLQPLPLPQNN